LGLNLGRLPATTVPEDTSVGPNERVSLFDAAFPGTLPVCLQPPTVLKDTSNHVKVINPVCISLATRTALALHADIQAYSAFDRKHYFYGDLPAGYQITQNYGIISQLTYSKKLTPSLPEAPFAKGGYIQLVKGQKAVRIKQIQIEQDTAKSTNEGLETIYDLNRVGMPLLEIVSYPDITSAEQAGEYVRTLQAILRSIGVSDGMMEAVRDSQSLKSDAEDFRAPFAVISMFLCIELGNHWEHERS
jgi:aspartyl-tRNA(Asn)/glutamyl-tRNA(Gln) amidotransferase subunit B